MRGYDSTSYGDGFADVYDDWYAEVTDVDATTARVVATLGSDAGRVLELGVGTGRLALPLADRNIDVVGVDSSQAMLDRLADRQRDRPHRVTAVCGDMATELPDGPFDVALVAYNTLFNLLGDGEQQACFHAVAERLAPGGAFIVEAVVPDETAQAGSDVSVRSMAVDRVVLSVSDHRPDQRRTSGQFVEFTESGGVRLRPWSIRWASVDDLDAMAASAGLALDTRFANMAGDEFDEHSTQHVSVYRAPR
ncbi:class I SAM-dependent methyltransferase [Ilumatobacter coccineus]|nr:class I SAM-dependent methyltransferase [Ilumatobacter coccineus]